MVQTYRLLGFSRAIAWLAFKCHRSRLTRQGIHKFAARHSTALLAEATLRSAMITCKFHRVCPRHLPEEVKRDASCRNTWDCARKHFDIILLLVLRMFLRAGWMWSLAR